jgi:hypothetical protein
MKRLLAGMLIGGLTVLAALTIAAPASAAPSHGWNHHCGSQPQPGAGWYNVRSFNVNCPKARSVARRFWNSGGDGPRDWNCKSKRLGDEVWRADCTRRRGKHRHVRFIYGA